MSTRATYKIYDYYNDIDVCFYKHHDNYPAGAAYFFKNMLEMRKKAVPLHIPAIGYADAFFRANENVRHRQLNKGRGMV